MGMDAAIFKNPFYVKLYQKGRIASGSRSPMPGQTISADAECHEIEIMEIMTAPSSSRRDGHCRSDGPFSCSLRTERVSWESTDL